MKKFRLFTVFLLLTISILGNTKYFMWQVKDSDTTIYLAPTVHLLPNDFYPINEKVIEKLENSDYLAVEFDVTKEENLQIIISQGAKYMYNEGFAKISTMISEEEYINLSAAFEKRGVDLRPLEYLSPFFLSQTLIQLELGKKGYTANTGLDKYFIQIAKEKGIEILELEDPISQLKTLSLVDKDYMLKSLVEGSKDDELAKGIRLLEELVKKLQEGNIKEFEAIFKMMTEEEKESSPLYEKLLDERNIGMTDKIVSYLENEGVYFVAVGGGHYVGPNSIIEMLQSRGYSVEEVNLD